jgi:tRNA (guanine-N7-)-methyltransferase
MARLRKSGWILKDASVRAELVRAHAEFGLDAPVFSLEPDLLFARAAPLEVEIGAGKGDFILEHARQFPERNFLAIELGGSVYQWLAICCMRSGLPNLRAIRADARPVVNLMLPRAGVSAFYIYFPDPWPKSRHSKHRLFNPTLACGLMRSLEPGGRLYLATDVEWYFHDIVALLGEAGFSMTGDRPPGVARTNFGRRFEQAGRPIHVGCFQPRADEAAVNPGPVYANG